MESELIGQVIEKALSIHTDFLNYHHQLHGDDTVVRRDDYIEPTVVTTGKVPDLLGVDFLILANVDPYQDEGGPAELYIWVFKGEIENLIQRFDTYTTQLVNSHEEVYRKDS